jgi:outer membrane receptor protein involved in Fe transport
MVSKSILPSKRLWLALALSALLAATALAQSQATTGNIEGRVLDQNGAAIVNATVTAKNQANGSERTVAADSGGNYRIILLQPGQYTVTATANGFARADLSNVPVSVGGNSALDITLAAGGASVTVDVSAEGQAVETGRTSIATTVNQKAIENLPVNGRNYLDFATLTPGVIRDPTRGGDLSVGGQKGTLNSLQVDGVDNNNTFFGQAFGRAGVRPPYQFSEESVQEFQVNQNGFSAEFGRAGGGVINVITRSGENDFHGSGFYFLRDEALNSNTPVLSARNAKRPKSQIKQFGGTFSGPIKQNRAFFFFTYDGQRANVPNVLDPPNFATQPANIRALLLPRLNTYNIGRDQDVFMVKTDIALNQSNNLTLRFNSQDFTGNNNENGGPLSAEEHSGNSVAQTFTFSGSLTSTLTPKLANEFRFQFARDKEPGEANSDQPEARIQTGGGFLFIGRNNFSPRETTIKRAQFINNLSYQTGRHSFKFGGDLNFDRVLNFFPGLFTGQFTFSSYAAFAANTPASYTQSFAGAGTTGPTTRPNTYDIAFYMQDDWRPTAKLTLNLGVRYDYQGLAAPQITNPALAARGLNTAFQPQDKNNLAPRVGLSYAFDAKTVLRAGYGVFYSRTPSIMLATATSNNGLQITNVNLNCTVTPNPCPIYPAIFSAQPTGAAAVAPSVYLFDKDYVQPYVMQGRLGFERELWRNLSFSANYQFYRGVHLGRTRDINLGNPVNIAATGFDGGSFTIQRFPSARPIAGFTRVNLFESTATSRYNGLSLQANQRFTRKFQFLAIYTYSKARDDRPDQTAVVVGADDSKLVFNPLNPRLDAGRSDLDLRHRFVFSPVYETGKFNSPHPIKYFLSDYTFSAIVQLQSGFAFSPGITGDINRDGNAVNDRVPGLERNSGTTPKTAIVDLRVTRAIPFGERYKLSFVAEAFNLFNRSNVATVNAARYGSFTVNDAAGTATLNAPNAATPFRGPRTFIQERQLQLAVKFTF